ncbi:MAG: sigma-70 family RNA polymerase sigma factor [Acidobacteriota bacterium]
MKSQKDYPQLDERALILLAQRGDRAAQREIYDRHRDRLHRLVFYSIDDPLAAEDMLQTVFLKIYRALPHFRFESSLSTWTYRIALNECLNHNQRRRADQVPLDAILGSGEEIDPAESVDDQHARREMSRILQQTVRDLPPRLRAVVVLKYVEGLSYDEIAQVTGCAPGTVASRLSRALTRMEERLRPIKKLL